MQYIGLKAAITKVFPTATNITIKSGYRQRTAWFDMNEKTYYLHTDHLGTQTNNTIYYREAAHRKDYVGGGNQWGFVSKLNSLGYECIIASTSKDQN